MSRPSRTRQRVRAGFLWALLGTLLLSVGLSMLTNTAWLRAQARVRLEQLLASLLQGEVHIDRVAGLSLGGVIAEGVTVRDAARRPVLHATQLSLGLDAFALLHGTLHFTHGTLSDVRIHAIESESAAISLFDALSPKASGDDDESPSALRILFDNVHVEHARLYGNVPGLANLEATGLEVRGQIHVTDALHVKVSQLRAALIAPYPEGMRIEQATLTLDTLPLRVSAHVRLSEGADRVHAALTYQSPDQGDDALDLRLALEPVSSTMLLNLGVAAAQVLVPDVRGSVRLYGPSRQLAYSAALTSTAGKIALSGALPEAGGLSLFVVSDHLLINELIAYAPPVSLGLSLRASAAPGKAVHIDADLPSLDVLGHPMRDGHIEGDYEGERFHFKNARVNYAGGHFDISGWVDNDADLYVRLRSNVPDVARDPSIRRAGLSAALRTDVQLAKAGDELSFEGSVQVERLAYAELTADTLSLEGEATFDEDLAQPTLRLTGHGTGVAVAGYPLGTVDFRGTGARGRYDSRVRAQSGDGRTAALDLSLEQRGATSRFVASSFELQLPNRDPWRAKADVSLTPDGVRIDLLELKGGPQSLTAQGSYSYSKAYRVDAQMQKFDLGGLRELTGADLADLDGTIDGSLALTGVPHHPRVDANLTLQQGVFLGMTDLSVALKLVFAEGRFDLDTSIVLPDKSRVAVFAGGTPGPGAEYMDQIQNGEYEFGLDFEHVPFEVSRPWLAWIGREPPPGKISAVLRGTGKLDNPSLTLKSQVRGLALFDLPAMDVDLELAHDKTTFALQKLRISDSYGELVSASGNVTVSLPELLRFDAFRGSLRERPFSLAVQTPRRRLDQLPPPARVDLPVPAVLKVNLDQTASGPVLAVDASLGFPTAESGVAACDGVFRRPEASLQFQTSGERGVGTAEFKLDGQRVGKGELDADIPLAAWLTGERAFALPRVGMKLDLNTLGAEELPLLCESMAGPLSLSATASDLFASPPRVHVNLRSDALQLAPHESQRQRLGNLRNARALGKPVALDVDFSTEADQLAFRGTVKASDGTLTMSGSMPSGAGGGAPASTSSAIDVQLRAQNFEISPLSIALPLPVRTSGVLNGDARFHYDQSAKRVALSGALDFRKGNLGIAPLGQQLSDVEARLVFEQDRVHVQKFFMRDFDGTLDIRGELEVPTPSELRADLTVALANFVVRSEGVQVSKLTGSLGLRAEIDPQKTRAEMLVKDLRVNLPSDLGIGLQELEAHPNISVIGEEPAAVPDKPYLFELRVVAQKPPFLVLRADLNADVLTDLTVRYKNPDLTLQGGAQIKRGNFELYGRRFDLQDSRLAFDGDDQLDPLISLYATHKVGKDEIGVRVEGRLSEPKITFTHSNPAITDTGSIVAQLLGVRTTDPRVQTRNANSAAAGILAGATAGLLTEKVRQQFGGAVPVVSMDSAGNSLQGARIRAGVQLDQVIEKRLGPLRKVVRGAYIEGFVAPGASSTNTINPNAPPQSRGGGLLELRFPADMVGTVEYRPVQNWRVDVAWEP